MQIVTLVLALPLLASGALHGHAKLHKRAHAVAGREVKVNVVTVTEIVTVTVDADAATTSAAAILLTSASSSPAPTPSVSETSAAPSKDGNDKGVNSYPALVPIANSAMIKNSCDYAVYVWSDGDPSCEGPAAKGKLVEVNGTHVETMRKCPQGGVALKVSKNQSEAKPMQFEYAIWEDHKTVSYDISYLNCMNNDNGEKDLSQCAGHDGGIQATGGGDCKKFQCTAGQWCDVNAYVVPEFGYLPNAPVGGCTVDKGIAFELCAGARV